MPIWLVAPVEEAPSLILVNWFIAETDKNERHFIGYNITDSEGRVSSPIQQFDKENMTGVTQSGRVYQLRGNPGYNADAMYVWKFWCSVNSVNSWKDVTTEILLESD